MSRRAPAGQRHILIANPSADVYGSDLQMLDSITALMEAGYRVTVSVPTDGPLVPQIRARGAVVVFTAVPPVQRAALSPRGLVRLAGGSAAAVSRSRSLIRRLRVDLVYVNTVILPTWIVAARLSGVPVVCHVHEAETADRMLLLKGLLAPVRLTTGLIANSQAALDWLVSVYPSLGGRTTRVFNGVSAPPTAARLTEHTTGPLRLIAISRLSPRKALDVALEALALLRADGRDVTLHVVGTAYPGYEWFEHQLRERAALPDLAGSVVFEGYVAPVWSVLEDSDVAIAPSLGESFGNAVVEAQLAGRPVIAAVNAGHQQTVQDGETGLLVPPGDAAALAAAVSRLIDDPELARALAERGLASAEEKFTISRYRREIAAAIGALLKA
ncbi:glycosyltransferase family 4 protein [Nakamurella sp. A5-74]|uniref:Glycosyltransferase family 4 protein n=1 Tax=Nakamurella sp. A5-74 TaxID=3158264 RepID=A0AAU8DLS5_9ACTN